MRATKAYAAVILTLFLFSIESSLGLLAICIRPTIPNAWPFAALIAVLSADLIMAVALTRKIDMASKTFRVERILLLETATFLAFLFLSGAHNSIPCRRGQGLVPRQDAFGVDGQR